MKLYVYLLDTEWDVEWGCFFPPGGEMWGSELLERSMLLAVEEGSERWWEGV